MRIMIVQTSSSLFDSTEDVKLKNKYTTNTRGAKKRYIKSAASASECKYTNREQNHMKHWKFVHCVCVCFLLVRTKLTTFFHSCLGRRRRRRPFFLCPQE